MPVRDAWHDGQAHPGTLVRDVPMQALERLEQLIRANGAESRFVVAHQIRALRRVPGDFDQGLCGGHALEMGATAFLEKPAIGQLDAHGARHQVLGVLDAPVDLAGSWFLVLAHAVELERPVLETGLGVELP